MRLGDYYPLREFALSAREGFTFRDKQTLRWGLIYAMIATSSTGLISAELGFTELPVAGVLARLRKPNMATYDTKQGRFIEGVEAGGLSCRFWQLESHAGTLDDMQIIKNYWKVSGSARGVHFPAPPYVLGKVKMNLDRPCRQWPDQDAVLCSGIRIR